MDIREYLQTKEKGFYKILCNNLTTERRKQLYDAINEWHQSKVNNGVLDDVRQQRELLLAFAEYVENIKYNISKHRMKRYVNEFLKANNCG